VKLPVLLFIPLFCSVTHALGINERIEVSEKIMKIYRDVCSITSEKHIDVSEIKAALELAAIYVIHGEYNNMKEQVLKARSISKSKACQKAIDDFLI